MENDLMLEERNVHRIENWYTLMKTVVGEFHCAMPVNRLHSLSQQHESYIS
jgi:hypothetical protein